MEVSDSTDDTSSQPQQSLSDQVSVKSSHGLKTSVRDPEIADTDLFTFKPKLSSTSARIAENLNTDFMERQMQHIEKRKKLSRSMSPSDLAEALADKKLAKKKETTSQAKGEQSLSDCLKKTSKSKNRTCNSEWNLTATSESTSAAPVLSKGLAQWAGLDSVIHPNLLGDSDRSKTLPVAVSQPSFPRRLSSVHAERLYQAKIVTEKAIKMHKVFVIQGGYNIVRQSLRRRGWVEKFFVKPPCAKMVRVKRQKMDDDDDSGDISSDVDDIDDVDGMDYKNSASKIPPWEEDSGIYGIMSRMIKYANPSLYWVLRRDAVEYKTLSREAMVNHYTKAGSFTTKIGLCVNMRNVHLFDDANPNKFFPRCYRLCNDDEKADFIDDYRLTACASILQISLRLAAEQRKREQLKEAETSDTKTNQSTLSTQTEQSKLDPENRDSISVTTGQSVTTFLNYGEKFRSPTPNMSQRSVSIVIEQGKRPKTPSQKGSSPKLKKSKSVVVPRNALTMAIQQIQRYISICNHDDIDTFEDPYLLNDSSWSELLSWYYQLRSSGGYFEDISIIDDEKIKETLESLEAVRPQLKIDGIRNVWILKPGAKSRGRGITCYNKLEDILKLVKAQVTKCESKYVVQKYIERPLLIYNTKFDIRQWFLVTDWNPLTIWFYQDCYLRFCSQQFTLENFDESIHLSNNSIQKHYKNGPRSEHLPRENMWTHYQFIDFLRDRNHERKWEEVIYPGMKKAVICALLSTQDIIEYRKTSFELYGADFMLTEDFSPWLIEINSSPSMEKSTSVTAVLCENVLEDTIKIVVDRKSDRNCDIGRFELAYKQAYISIPSYVGLNMCIEGQALKRAPEERRFYIDLPSNPFFHYCSEKDKIRCNNQGGNNCSYGDHRRDKLWIQRKDNRVEKINNEIDDEVCDEFNAEWADNEQIDNISNCIQHKDNMALKKTFSEPLVKDHRALRPVNKICDECGKEPATMRIRQRKITKTFFPPLYDAGRNEGGNDKIIKSQSDDNFDSVHVAFDKKNTTRKSWPKSIIYSHDGEGKARRFVSRTSVADSYPVLSTKSSLSAQHERLYSTTKAKENYSIESLPMENSACFHKGNKNIPSNLLSPLTSKNNLKNKKLNLLKDTNFYSNSTNTSINLTDNSITLERYLKLSKKTRLKCLNISRHLSAACVCPPPMNIVSRQPGIYIQPLKY